MKREIIHRPQYASIVAVGVFNLSVLAPDSCFSVLPEILLSHDALKVEAKQLVKFTDFRSLHVRGNEVE